MCSHEIGGLAFQALSFIPGQQSFSMNKSRVFGKILASDHPHRLSITSVTRTHPMRENTWGNSKTRAISCTVAVDEVMMSSAHTVWMGADNGLVYGNVVPSLL